MCRLHTPRGQLVVGVGAAQDQVRRGGGWHDVGVAATFWWSVCPLLSINHSLNPTSRHHDTTPRHRTTLDYPNPTPRHHTPRRAILHHHLATPARNTTPTATHLATRRCGQERASIARCRTFWKRSWALHPPPDGEPARHRLLLAPQMVLGMCRGQVRGPDPLWAPQPRLERCVATLTMPEPCAAATPHPLLFLSSV